MDDLFNCFIKVFKYFVENNTTNAIDCDEIMDFEWDVLFDEYQKGVTIENMVSKICEYEGPMGISGIDF